MAVVLAIISFGLSLEKYLWLMDCRSSKINPLNQWITGLLRLESTSRNFLVQPLCSKHGQLQQVTQGLYQEVHVYHTLWLVCADLEFVELV